MPFDYTLPPVQVLHFAALFAGSQDAAFMVSAHLNPKPWVNRKAWG